MPRLPLLLTGLCLCACGGPSTTPQGALEAFFRCTQAGDDAGARRLLVDGEQKDADCRLDRSQVQDGWVLGSVDLDDNRACILVDQKGVHAAMRWALQQEHGQWRVSLRETAKASFGADSREKNGMSAALQKLSGELQQRANGPADGAKAKPAPR